MTASYVLGPGGEQVSEMAVTGTYGNYSSSWQHTNVFADGSLLATYNGTETYFALSDWLGTKRAEITPDGQSARFFELPYGNGLTSTGSLADATEQHFTGKERDSETGEANGNDYFGARYYASAMGRFMSPDDGSDQDSTDPQSWNLYTYVRNNPLINTDPDGHGCSSSIYVRMFEKEVAQTETSFDNSDCADPLSGLWHSLSNATNQASQIASQATRQLVNIMNTPGGARCMGALAGGGVIAGGTVGGGVGLVGLAGGGVGVVVTEPTGLAIGAGGGGLSGIALAMTVCPGGAANGGGRGGTGSETRLTISQQRQTAKYLGMKEVKGMRSQGEPVFEKNGRYFSFSRTAHSRDLGEVFKELNRNGKRIFTTDINFNRIGP